MRRLLFLVVIVMVNIPLVHEQWTEHRIDADGRDTIARVVHSRTLNQRHFVDFRLPRAADPEQTTWSARLDEDAFAAARRSAELVVRYVPGDPAANRAAGEVVPSRLFWVVTGLGDLVLLMVVLILWTRGRRWRVLQVRWVGEDLVGVDLAGRVLVCQAPQVWLERARPGDRPRASLHLLAASDIVPTLPLAGESRIEDARYLIRGRVQEVRRGGVVLELADGYRLHVEAGPFRNRADLREHGEVTGTLMLTP